MNILGALSPMEIALVTVALAGIVPVVVQYRDRSKWFALGYGTLVVAAVSTNLEGLFLGTVFNLMEHGVGLMGAGLAFFAAAYVHRRRIVDGRGDGHGGDGQAVAESGPAEELVGAGEVPEDG